MAAYVEFGKPLNDYCEATSASLGTGSPSLAGGIDRRAQTHDFHFTKDSDSFSPKLFEHCAIGTRFPSVLVEFFTREGIPYIVYTLNDVLIASCSTGGGSDSIGLNYGSMAAEYYK